MCGGGGEKEKVYKNFASRDEFVKEEGSEFVFFRQGVLRDVTRKDDHFH